MCLRVACVTCRVLTYLLFNLHTARDVALALASVFSRVGFLNEILSDLGTDFTSELMQIFLQSLVMLYVCLLIMLWRMVLLTKLVDV